MNATNTGIEEEVLNTYDKNVHGFLSAVVVSPDQQQFRLFMPRMQEWKKSEAFKLSCLCVFVARIFSRLHKLLSLV